MRAVALLTSLSLLGAGGCFPHDPHARTIAKLSEGGAIAVGIGLLALAGTGADCDAMTMGALGSNDSCHTKATVLSDIGLALLLGGLSGFIATVSTAEEDRPVPTTVITAPPPPPPVKAPDPATPMKVPAPEPTPAPAPPPPAPAPTPTP
jgi:hypothetical protein